MTQRVQNKTKRKTGQCILDGTTECYIFHKQCTIRKKNPLMCIFFCKHIKVILKKAVFRCALVWMNWRDPVAQFLINTEFCNAIRNSAGRKTLRSLVPKSLHRANSVAAQNQALITFAIALVLSLWSKLGPATISHLFSTYCSLDLKPPDVLSQHIEKPNTENYRKIIFIPTF